MRQRQRELHAFRRGDLAAVLILHLPAMMMTTPERFVAEREAAWEELEAALRRAGDRPEKLGPDGVRRLGELYRATAADLAFARRTLPGDEPLVGRLEGLVLRGACRGLRARGAARRRCGRSSRAATGAGWPSGRRCCSAAWLLLLVPAGLGALWGLVDAPAAAGLIPADFQSAADPPAEGRDYDAAEASAFSFQVMFNNIQVTLIAFAGGITFGAADRATRCSSTGCCWARSRAWRSAPATGSRSCGWSPRTGRWRSRASSSAASPGCGWAGR